MKNTRFTKTLFVTICICAAVIACSKDDSPQPGTPAYNILLSEKTFIPNEITLGADSTYRVATLFAEGVQKYKAQVKAGGTPTDLEWAFVAPKADLFDINNKKVGTHSVGPTWQLSTVDSFYAAAFSPARTAKSPTDQSTTIDWLLLMSKPGKTATGFFSNVAYVQRILTVGGKAPVAPPVQLTDTIDVKYTAVYRFSGKK